MRRRRWAKGGRRAALLASLTLVLAGCSANDWEKRLRFGFPTGVTKQATKIRVLWTWAGVTALILGIIMWSLIFWCCLRYRARKLPDGEVPRQTKYNATVELVCFAFPFVIIAGLFYRTVIVEDNVNHLSKNPEVSIQADAFKWNWTFEYHGTQFKTGPDHEGPQAQKLLEAYTGADGKMATDPENKKLPYYLQTTGSSDVIPILVIPVNRSVQVDEHSLDVIHSFWVPEFLFKRDILPYGSTSTSRDNKFEFTATKTGSYVGRCAELCGVYHSQMNFEVRVVSDTKFDNYMAALKKVGPDNPNAQAVALKMAKMAPYATTTYPLETNREDRGASKNQHTAGD